MSIYESIRFFSDEEVNQEIKVIARYPMFKSLVNYTYPDKSEQEINSILNNIKSISDFQEHISIKTLKILLDKTSDGLTVSGIDKIDSKKAYVFISNHRDILLDTSLLNFSLQAHNKIMTASAIGDNLVQNKFLLNLAKINRNFIVKRNTSSRELLKNSRLLSEYIQYLVTDDNRSIWIAQKEGRTKDGNDVTNSGVLKMLAMAGGKEALSYLKKIQIIPVSISYEYDPTDKLKMPQIIANLNNQEYVKAENEDFMNIMSGAMGKKKRIHIHIGTDLNQSIERINEQKLSPNKQIIALAEAIDEQIIANYKLWPTNYIAYDLLYKTRRFSKEYTEYEERLFLRRLEMRVDINQQVLVDKFLEMYANPVKNKLKL